MPLRSVLFAIVVTGAVPAVAQSNGERMANDPYSRSHDYDLIHQRIEVGDFDWDQTTFTGRVTMTVRALRPRFDSVVVDAGRLLEIRRVTGPHGAALAHQSRGDTLVIHLRQVIGWLDTVRFTVDYGGKVDNGRGLTFIPAEPGVPHRPQQIWSMGETQDNHLWFPTYDFPNDKATWEVVATVPRGFTAVSNGRLLTDRTNRDGTRTMQWRQGRPASTYLVSLVVAPLVKLSDAWHGVPVDYYVYREDSALARPLFRETPDMMEVFSDLTGVKYPWAKYAQTTVADFFGGMENVSATTLVDWLPDARAYVDRPWYQYILIPHELAHQWFGDYVTTANWANTWLNEGFAEFMPGQYWKVRLGRLAEDDYYLDEYDQFMALDPRRRMPLAALGSNNIYPKGALVLEMLKHYLGEARFWAAIHRYLTDHALGVATTDDFRQAVLTATGENLSWFWDQWIYQAGYPEFAVAASWDSTAGRVTLTVRQTQADTATADSTGLRYSTPAVFRGPVTIRVGTGGRDVTRRVWLEAREQAITIDSVPGQPTMVVFDDENALLKKLNFPQPTDWLATQLRRDPDLWNRRWAMEQLAARPQDEAAGQALARAAREADYPLTRADAVESLAGFPEAVARPAVRSALRDTSARVRAAALTALGALGGDGAAGLARSAFEGDTSYEVRAAALGTLMRLDSLNRRALIQTGLDTPSYRDVIQRQALGAIIGTNDTTFLDALDRQVEPGRLSAHALARLGAQGSARALDLLAARLNDPRGSVRRSALDAITRGLPPELAGRRLQSVVDELKFPETRRAAAKAMAALGQRP